MGFGLFPMIVGKILRNKIHILHLKALPIQPGQGSGVGGKVELQAIGVEGLAVAAILFVLPLPAIFAVPDEGVSGAVSYTHLTLPTIA